MPAHIAAESDPEPFGHARAYLEQGWSPMPLPAGQQKPPPDDVTGRHDCEIGAAHIDRWMQDRRYGPTANIAVRLADDVLGIDVDHYVLKDGKAKRGGDTLAELESKLGPLPATWTSTSRRELGDTVSGIRCYRVPEGMRWRTTAGDDIDIIQHRHRYVCVAPSLSPKTGKRYAWLRPNGTAASEGVIPHTDDLAYLPDEWISFLTNGGQLAGDDGPAPEHVEAPEWLGALPSGIPCDVVADRLQSALSELESGGTRHDVALVASQRLAHLGAQGHVGVADALGELGDAFVAAVGDDRGRREAWTEWERMLSGAVDRAAAEDVGEDEVCVCHLASLRLVVTTEEVEPPTAPRKPALALVTAGVLPRGVVLPSGIALSDAELARQQEQEEFWTFHPRMETLRRYAWARRCSPWAMLGVEVVRGLCALPAHVVLPPIIGGRVSPNLFVGIAAESGGSKGAATNAGWDFLAIEPAPELWDAGTGEGFIQLYGMEEGPKGAKRWVRNPDVRAVLLDVPEVAGLAALKSRPGATLSSVLCKAAMGEQLSTLNANPVLRRRVEKNTYRMGMIVGIQFANAGALFDEIGTGLPQRFLWTPAAALLPPWSQSEQEWVDAYKPERLHIEDRWLRAGDVRVCDAARREIRDAHDARMERAARRLSVGPELDGHRLLVREKLAVGLSVLLYGTADVSEELWARTLVPMRVSDETREDAWAGARRRRYVESEAEGEVRAAATVAHEEAVETRRVDATILKWQAALMAAGRPLTREQLRGPLPGRLKTLDANGDSVVSMAFRVGVSRGLLREHTLTTGTTSSTCHAYSLPVWAMDDAGVAEGMGHVA